MMNATPPIDTCWYCAGPLGDAVSPRYCSPACKRFYREAAYRDAGRCPRCGRYAGDHDNGCRLGIYERDGWICQICHLPVDPTLADPDPGAASLDHILPRARRGVSSSLNLRLAHRSCNHDRDQGSFAVQA